jgi:hypothetical protein
VNFIALEFPENKREGGANHRADFFYKFPLTLGQVLSYFGVKVGESGENLKMRCIGCLLVSLHTI